jgi:nitroreductase
MFDTTPHDFITKSIIKSQHCQRNWDLSREIPEDDLKVLITAATECPSKQNVAYYKAHFITNRELIEQIHDNTDGFIINAKQDTTTNTQTLANLLVVLENYSNFDELTKYRNAEISAIKRNSENLAARATINRDRDMAVGVAAGYLNLTASLLGYATGCCACFDSTKIKEILSLESDPVLLMGIGYKNPLLPRRVHHLDHTYTFPTKSKQTIPYSIIK